MPSLEDRVAALEHRNAEMSRELADVRLLATGASEESGQAVAATRTFTRLLNETRQEMRDGFDALTGEVRAKFDQVAAGQQTIVEMLSGLIEQGGSRDDD